MIMYLYGKSCFLEYRGLVVRERQCLGFGCFITSHFNDMSYHIISYHIIPYHIISFYLHFYPNAGTEPEGCGNRHCDVISN